MTTLEDLIYGLMISSQDLGKKLSSYEDKAAVFYQAAPDDRASGWKGKKQYPRIDYIVDMQSNPERKTSGTLTLDIWSSEDGTPPEELEPIVRQLLCGVFLNPDESSPYSLAWTRSDVFESKTKETELVVGITMIFDVFAFPSQITTDPDPILAINHFVKNLIPESVIIGHDEIAKIHAPGQKHPTFYFRLASLQNQRETNTVVWMDAVIAGHIFANGEEISLIKMITESLSIEGEVIMMDESPMFIQNIKADSSMDPLSAGQIRITVRFGLLRRKKYAHTLQQFNIPR